MITVKDTWIYNIYYISILVINDSVDTGRAFYEKSKLSQAFYQLHGKPSKNESPLAYVLQSQCLVNLDFFPHHFDASFTSSFSLSLSLSWKCVWSKSLNQRALRGIRVSNLRIARPLISSDIAICLRTSLHRLPSSLTCSLSHETWRIGDEWHALISNRLDRVVVVHLRGHAFSGLN